MSEEDQVVMDVSKVSGLVSLLHPLDLIDIKEQEDVVLDS